MASKLNKFSISGFKSIRELKDFEVKKLNVLIGANGAGKSNFIQIFRMLGAMTQQSFRKFIDVRGGADNFLHNGPKETVSINAQFEFDSGSQYKKGTNSYQFELSPTVDGYFLVKEDRAYCDYSWRSYGSPNDESHLYDERNEKSRCGTWNGVGHFVYRSIESWKVYHFHDTSETAAMRRFNSIYDNQKLREDASNLAAFLLELRDSEWGSSYYDDIVNAVRLVTPFFEDFLLTTIKRGEEEQVRLDWTQKGSDFPMQPYHFSDGSIRFICLATALLQPKPPSIVVVDEPELGLHPGAIAILAELIETTSERTQVIVSTQSPELINYFSVEDIVVVNRKEGQSTFERLDEKDYSVWLEDYSIGELWTKNVIAGGTRYE